MHEPNRSHQNRALTTLMICLGIVAMICVATSLAHWGELIEHFLEREFEQSLEFKVTWCKGPTTRISIETQCGPRNGANSRILRIDGRWAFPWGLSLQMVVENRTRCDDDSPHAAQDSNCRLPTSFYVLDRGT